MHYAIILQDNEQLWYVGAIFNSEKEAVRQNQKVLGGKGTIIAVSNKVLSDAIYNDWISRK